MNSVFFVFLAFVLYIFPFRCFVKQACYCQTGVTSSVLRSQLSLRIQTYIPRSVHIVLYNRTSPSSANREKVQSEAQNTTVCVNTSKQQLISNDRKCIFSNSYQTGKLHVYFDTGQSLQDVGNCISEFLCRENIRSAQIEQIPKEERTPNWCGFNGRA